jgi:hypothetical protein
MFEHTAGSCQCLLHAELPVCCGGALALEVHSNVTL